ncbi:hypothetical protein PAPHI01_0315 [Pancytospora philotis]|nr:hypothetical protein PAPHI01_0315 [Pancytospora philotis]
MQVRQFVRALMLTEVFVGARLSAIHIADVLEKAYGHGEYVDPEGPLNIMRGHPCVNNGMITKQYRFSAPMRPGYSSTGDCAYARNAHEDGVRKFPSDSEAMAYIAEHYTVLKSMFTVDNEMAVVDKSPQAPFWNLFRSERGKCVELFAALLVLAGGGDIRLRQGSDGCSEEGKQNASLVIYDGATSLRAYALDLDFVDAATLAAVEFFVKHGGERAGQIAGYGLHYTDSPSFLIQAYVCEFIEDRDIAAGTGIFEAAKEIVAKLPANSYAAHRGQRFFTKDRNYVGAYLEGYKALYDAEMGFDEVQRALLMHWQNFRHENYSGGDDSRGTVSTLLKLCYCLCSNPAINSWDSRLLDSPQNELLCALRDFTRTAFAASNTLNIRDYFLRTGWERVGKYHADFLAVAKTRAAASEAITDCCAGDISAGLVTDPKNFLVVLAWILGEPEAELRSLQQLLNEVLSDTGRASHCKQISARVTQMLGPFYANAIRAHFGVWTAADGTRHGSLWLVLHSDRISATYKCVLKLVFRPEKVYIMYVSQQTTLSDCLRAAFVSALEKLRVLGRSSNTALSAPANRGSDGHNNFPLHALLRECVERCLDPVAHRAVCDMHLAKVSAAKDPLARHIAISHWMAYQPMLSLGEMVKAGDRLLPVFEELLARSTDGSDASGAALAADNPVVAVLDNILGSVVAFDDALRFFVVDGLRYCVNARTDLLPSTFSFADTPPCYVQELGESAYGCFLACLAKYDMPEISIRHIERCARSRIRTGSSVQGPFPLHAHSTLLA